MTDKTKLAEDDGDELIPVETPLDDATGEGVGGNAAEDEGDERIAESDDDLDADTESGGDGAEGGEVDLFYPDPSLRCGAAGHGLCDARRLFHDPDH